MSLKHGLLGLLTIRKSSGYDLSKLFQESLSFFWVANQSQIYRELDKMEDIGWVVSSKVEQDARPNKRVYGITKEGNQELIRWLKEENAEDLSVVRNPLLMKLFFSGKVEKEHAVAFLKNYRAICEEAREEIARQVADIGKVEETAAKPAYWLYATDYSIRQYDFQIKWIDETVDRLESLK